MKNINQHPKSAVHIYYCDMTPILNTKEQLSVANFHFQKKDDFDAFNVEFNGLINRRLNFVSLTGND